MDKSLNTFITGFTGSFSGARTEELRWFITSYKEKLSSLSLFLKRFLHLTCDGSTSLTTGTKAQLMSSETHQTHVLVDVLFGQRVKISAKRNKQSAEDTSDISRTHLDMRRN